LVEFQLEITYNFYYYTSQLLLIKYSSFVYIAIFYKKTLRKGISLKVSRNFLTCSSGNYKTNLPDENY